jgi:hypothetical protein
MDIPHWLSTPAFVAAIAAVLGSLVPIVIKVLNSWMSRASTSLFITLRDGNKVFIEAKSLDPNAIGQIIDALTAEKAKDKADANE